ADGPGRAPLDEAVDLRAVLLALPPHRAGHAPGELAAAGERAVGGVALVADDRLLPLREAERVEVALGLAEPRDEVFGRLLGDEALDEVGGALVERPGGGGGGL